MDKKEFKLKVKEYKGGSKKNAFEIGVYLHNIKKYKKAIKYFEEYITLPDAYKIFDAKKYIADYYYNGFGVKKDIPKAIKMYDDICFIYKDLKPIIIRYYYDNNDYSKIIYMIKDYIDNDIDALRFYCDYYKKSNSVSFVLPYLEMLAEKTKDESIIDDIVEYYLKYYEYSKDKQAAKNTLIKYKKNPKASFKLGQLYFYGIDCDQDLIEAYKYFLLSHKKGYSKSTPYIAYYRYNGIEEKQNINSALMLLRNSTEPLSRYYLFKHRVESNESLSYLDFNSFEKITTECGEAAAYLVKLLREKRYKGSVHHTPDRYINIAVGQMIPEGFLERGIAHYEKKEYKEAFEDLTYAYERNQKEASIYLSKLYKDGLGCRKSIKKAEELLNESNDENSIYIKAMDLLKENKTEEGIKLLTSIMNNHQEAKFEVATRYINNGNDKKQQEYGYKLLSELDMRIQKYNYTYIKCTYLGLGTKVDYQKFAKLINSYIKTSRYDNEKLDKELDYIVGEAYFKGNGLPKNNEYALKYLGYSKTANYKPAIVLYNEVDKVVKELEAIEAERKRIADEQRRKKEAELKAIEDAKKILFETLFKKYKDYRISIPEVKSIYGGYGTLGFTHEVDEYKKTSTIVVRGTMNYFIYLSENDKKNIAQNIYDYVKPYVDEFYKKYPDYPMSISIKHEFTIWHNC